jgi:hypothetical protein
VKSEKIQGGYYIKARCIQDSYVAHTPPYVREIWDWILKECNHADFRDIKRGQCVRTFKDIQDGLSWYIGYRKMKYTKWQCEKAMKTLLRATMIATRKTTRGLVITVINYDFYQNPKNYDSNTIATTEQQCADTIYKNDKNDKNNNTDNIYTDGNLFEKHSISNIDSKDTITKTLIKDTYKDKQEFAEYVHLTQKEYKTLIKKYGEYNTKRFIEKLDNTVGSNTKKYKYTSDYRAILNWVADAVLSKDTLKSNSDVKSLIVPEDKYANLKTITG